jgi:hypothetical protein
VCLCRRYVCTYSMDVLYRTFTNMTTVRNILALSRKYTVGIIEIKLSPFDEDRNVCNLSHTFVLCLRFVN